jgi:pimeloyl-ACP methyl ester carboxylesterase
MSDRARSTGVDSQLRFRGLTIAMRVQGEGEPLLLINGLTRPLATWEPFTRELTGRTVVTFDAPGVGGSSRPLLPFSIPALAEVAVAVLAAAGHARADVLGSPTGAPSPSSSPAARRTACAGWSSRRPRAVWGRSLERAEPC